MKKCEWGEAQERQLHDETLEDRIVASMLAQLSIAELVSASYLIGIERE